MKDFIPICESNIITTTKDHNNTNKEGGEWHYIEKTNNTCKVEGVDWVILNPRALLMKKKFKNKSLSKLNVGEASVGQSVGQAWYSLSCGVNIHSFISTHI